jgi:hypothetical protein
LSKNSRFYEDRAALRWDCLPIKGAVYHLGTEMNGMVSDTWKVMIDDEMISNGVSWSPASR